MTADPVAHQEAAERVARDYLTIGAQRGPLADLARAYLALLAQLREAQKDSERLDWLQSEEDRVDRVMSFVVKKGYDRTSGDWANIFGDVRHAIDAARRADTPTEEGK